MRWAARLLALAIVLAAGAGTAQPAPVKLALVIGNADYDGDGRFEVGQAGAAASEAAGYVPDLRNPMNDASDLGDALTRIGFRVDRIYNADAAAMRAALAAFSTKVGAAPSNANVVVYYAGHAIQVDGANFIIPVKSRIPATNISSFTPKQIRESLRERLVSTDEILAVFQERRAPGLNLLMLDSCRTNPWAQAVAAGRGVVAPLIPGARLGMAELRPIVPRTIILFATSPDAVARDGDGRNSPFAIALISRVGRTGPVLDMLDGVGADVQLQTNGGQTPWFQGASIGRQACLFLCVAKSIAERAELASPPAPKTRPGEEFRECDVCPLMVVIPAGKFLIGSPQSESPDSAWGNSNERPQREVAIRALAVAKFETTFAEWDSCFLDGHCAPPEEGPYRPEDEGWGRESRPVIWVSWQDAKRFVGWLNGRVGGKAYRLLTEAEWEYAARGGDRRTAWWWGGAPSRQHANYGKDACCGGFVSGRDQWEFTAPVGSFPANPFGLHDMIGNVKEWVEDCYERDYARLPADGSPNIQPGCTNRVVRGGSWVSHPYNSRSATRAGDLSSYRDSARGFRLARSL
ncbi:MAG: SUMF1/EgtB/PvdO family nonheme iron enzyme [Phycisphaerae bacterium]|nr:SUMF1/EgtB/PvdO family nonheme iron enzyme [Phycisphaerae bacterium]